MWPACSQALAMALQTHADLSWTPLLQQLQEAQRLHLTAARQPAVPGEPRTCPSLRDLGVMPKYRQNASLGTTKSHRGPFQANIFTSSH